MTRLRADAILSSQLQAGEPCAISVHAMLRICLNRQLRCVYPGSRNAGARVHAAAAHSEVKPARSDTQPGAVQAEVDMNAGSDANRTTKAETHSSEIVQKKGPIRRPAQRTRYRSRHSAFRG